MDTQTPKCLTPSCDNAPRSRGLCATCYKTAARLVNTGQTTWAQLETSGKALVLSKSPKKEWFLGK